MIHGQSIPTPPTSSAGQNPPAGAVLAAALFGSDAVHNGSTADPLPWPATSTEFMHARYFSPNLGRFLSVDPIGGEVGSSQSWNRYSYVLNNPLTHTDPHGMAVMVLDELALEYIRKTLPEGLQDQVALDEARLIDKASLNAIDSSDPSFLDLKGLVNLDPVVEVSTGSTFTYLDEQGKKQTESFLYLPATEQYEAAGLLGYTVGPGSNPHDTGTFLSTNANVQVTLTSDPRVPLVEMQRTTAEELYGHALLYLAGKPFMHPDPGVEELVKALHGRYPR